MTGDVRTTHELLLPTFSTRKQKGEVLILLPFLNLQHPGFAE